MKVLFRSYVLVLVAILAAALACDPPPAPKTIASRDRATQPPAPSGQSWQRHPNNPIVVPGFHARPGGTIGLNVADPSILYDTEERKWKMWFATGWGEGKNKRLVIKYAESGDGVNWNVEAVPALEFAADPGAWDTTQVETPAVIKNALASRERRYMLWYSGGNLTQREIAPGYPFYAIGLAFSSDGKRFTRLPATESPYSRAGLVFTARAAFPRHPKATDGVVADPAVVLKDGLFHMWFSSIGLDNRQKGVAVGIGFATSRDGIRWTASHKNPLESLERPENPRGSMQPSALWSSAKSTFEIWFTSDTESEKRRLPASDDGALGFWHATSRNGEDWSFPRERGRDFNWDGREPAEQYGLVTGVEVVLKDGQYWMYYAGFGSRRVPSGWPAVWALNLATRKASP